MADGYDIALLLLGVAFFAAAVLPPRLRGRVLSMPMLYVAAGLVLPALWRPTGGYDPVHHGAFLKRLTELAVILSLLGAGLKLDRPLTWQAWSPTVRLLAVTMPLCIAALVLGGHLLLGLPFAAALLLGAVLAPTDPVLAASVQVGPPGEGGEDDARFALTSEAGLNDGLAFPFVYLAIAWLAVQSGEASAGEVIARWLRIEVAWKILAGSGMGVLVGWLAGRLVFHGPDDVVVRDGFLAIALTFVAYAASELVAGYGFLGVFVAALVFRRAERESTYHRALHEFSEQVEQLLLAGLLLLLGAALADGLAARITWSMVVVTMGTLLVVRPATGHLALVGTPVHSAARRAIAFLGIRGIGTFYYLAFGLERGTFAASDAATLWAQCALVVVASVVLHSVAAPRMMARVAR